MNPINYALNMARREIPPEIIKEIFKPEYTGIYGKVESADGLMERIVIRPQVLVDCNLVGGIEHVVSLEGIWPDMTETSRLFNYVYRIPKERTMNRFILTVKGVSIFPIGMNHSSNMLYNPVQQNDLLNVSAALLSSQKTPPFSVTARAEVVATNTILIKDTISIGTYSSATCVLANDENMENLSLRSFPVFAELCVLAIKAHIYTHRVVKIDQAQLSGGLSLGAFKDEVDKYADAFSMYKECLREKWTAIAIMDDKPRWNKLIRYRIGGYR